MEIISGGSYYEDSCSRQSEILGLFSEEGIRNQKTSQAADITAGAGVPPVSVPALTGGGYSTVTYTFFD